MKIGVIKEVKDRESRVALTPAGAKELIEHGHRIVLETNAGEGSGFEDKEYKKNGVEIVTTEQAWDADLVLKVKEPLERSFKYFKDNIIFTYLHLAGVPGALTQALLDAKTTAIAYETVENAEGRFPLLSPMSAVAGNMAATMGAYYLAKFNGGRGILLGNIFYDHHGKAVVLGDGVVGQHAALTLDGMGAHVYLFGLNEDRFKQWQEKVSSNIQFVQSTRENIVEHIKNTDLLVGAVLTSGAKAPHIVTEDMVKTMQAGSVIVDVSIDQGGCFETSRPTTHSDPVYTKHGVIHYCVSNMPGAYPRTSTIALTKATLPYVIKLADQGLDTLRDDPGFSKGVNTHAGWVTCEPVAQALGYERQYKPFIEINKPYGG